MGNAEPFMSPDALEARRRRHAAKSARHRQTEKFKSTHAKWLRSGGRRYKTEWQAEKRAVQPRTVRPLTPGYVRQIFVGSSGIHPGDVPQTVVEVQAAHLRLKRELRHR